MDEAELERIRIHAHYAFYAKWNSETREDDIDPSAEDDIRKLLAEIYRLRSEVFIWKHEAVELGYEEEGDGANG